MLFLVIFLAVVWGHSCGERPPPLFPVVSGFRDVFIGDVNSRTGVASYAPPTKSPDVLSSLRRCRVTRAYVAQPR